MKRTTDWLLLLLALLSQMTPALLAAEDPSTLWRHPFLRIETGRHQERISQFVTNREGTLLATASLDKTVRLWSLPDGEMKGILRVPIADKGEGELYTLAISPDGRLLAVTGNTGPEFGEGYVIYFFDMEKSVLKTRLRNFEKPLKALSFSPDGQHLVGMFFDKIGMWIWSAQGKLVMRDESYQNTGTAMDFDRQGRLVTVSLDGKIRLYSSEFKKITENNLKSGKNPYSVAFSPDGKRIAVGYLDSASVDILVGDTLKPLSSVSAKDLLAPNAGEIGNLSSVAWSVDGTELLAGGSARNAEKFAVMRVFSQQGQGSFRDIPVGRDNIMQIRDLAQTGKVFVTADPAWGVMGHGDRIRTLATPVSADFGRILDARFDVSLDGLVVDFDLERNGSHPRRIDLTRLEVTEEPSRSGVKTRTLPPLTKLGKHNLAKMVENQSVVIDGSKLKLASGDVYRSVAARHDGKGFIVGTGRLINYFDVHGDLIKKIPSPAEVWRINISEDNTKVVAALGDGTLRWYSLRPNDELRELGTFFPHADGQRWILWTPEGFFVTSAFGGEDLAGYHMNNGLKQPEWTRFEQLYALFHDPDLVKKKLIGGHEEKLKARQAEIGDVTSLLRDKNAPQVSWLEYCPSQQKSRGLQRLASSTATNPEAAPETHRSCLEISTGISGTRGLVRKTAPASETTNQTAATTKPVAFRVELPEGPDSVRLRFRVAPRGGGIGKVNVFWNGQLADAGNTRGLKRSTPADSAPPPTDTANFSSPSSTNQVAGQKEQEELIIEREIYLHPGSNQILVSAFDAADHTSAESDIIELIRPKPNLTSQTVVQNHF